MPTCSTTAICFYAGCTLSPPSPGSANLSTLSCSTTALGHPCQKTIASAAYLAKCGPYTVAVSTTTKNTSLAPPNCLKTSIGLNGRPTQLGYRALRYLQPLDRKSTRLNSSHVAISYAVFCLKK